MIYNKENSDFNLQKIFNLKNNQKDFDINNECFYDLSNNNNDSLNSNDLNNFNQNVN